MPDNDTQNLESVDTVEQADALLEQIETPASGEIQDTQAQAQPQTQDEWELTVGGKAIKAKRDQIMQWAQQGYSAPGKISSLTREYEALKKKYADEGNQWKAMQEKYGPVDEYVRQNPQFWEHVTKSYEQRNNLLNDQSNPLAQTVNDLQAKIQDLIQYKNQVEEERQKHRTQEEDQAYLSTLQEVQKAYPDIDFVTADEEGKTLEYRVLEHAQQNGISSFKAAFRDFYFDELQKRSESKAKESLVKEKQKNTKLGVLGVTSAPQRKTSGDHRNKSYDDLAREALDELGIR